MIDYTMHEWYPFWCRLCFLSHKNDDSITLSHRIARVTLAPPTLLVCITKVQLIIHGNPLSKSYIVAKKRYFALIYRKEQFLNITITSNINHLIPWVKLELFWFFVMNEWSEYFGWFGIKQNWFWMFMCLIVYLSYHHTYNWCMTWSSYQVLN